MPNNPPDYERIEKEAWKESQSFLKKEAKEKSSRLEKRITTYIERFGYSDEKVIHKILNDEMFAAS